MVRFEREGVKFREEMLYMYVLDVNSTVADLQMNELPREIEMQCALAKSSR